MNGYSANCIKLPTPANDYVLPKVRLLTPSDVRCIVRDHAALLAEVFDFFSADDELRAGGLGSAVVALAHMHGVQRAIVWRGSWLTAEQVASLIEEESLLLACFEVLRAMREAGKLEEIQAIVIDELRPMCRALGAQPS